MHLQVVGTNASIIRTFSAKTIGSQSNVRVLEAEAQSTIQRSALFPQLGAAANHTNGGCNGQSCFDFAPQKNFGLTFNASYELDFWGLARDNLAAANEELKSARFAQEAVALTITANVANQYFSVLALRPRRERRTGAISSNLDQPHTGSLDRH